MHPTRFFTCTHCGNLVGLVIDKDVPMQCCGGNMVELIPGSVDAAKEKHLPVVKVDGDKVCVCVGSVEHPMTDEHSIDWVYLQTERGGQRKGLRAGEKPELCFALCDDKPVSAYAYCNLHGLWKTDI